MIKARDFTINTSYNDVLAEAEAKAKYHDLSVKTKLKEYKKLCATLHNSENKNKLEKAIIHQNMKKQQS